ncbi:MAG TPA: hypothetical protein VGD60_00375 [Candidatus Acidoferrales bacterium]
MRWIDREAEFKTIFLEARTCVYIDSGRRATQLHRLIFDDAQTCTAVFAEMLQSLMGWASDAGCYYIVLDPDPVHYFHRHFGKYPAIEIARGDSSDAYLKFLNEDPGNSPADAVGTNCWAWVIAPHSLKWFVHALRDEGDGGGHLWVPPEWAERLRTSYPFLRHDLR